ncbi:MAG: AAA family ATPase, partial [Methylococcaceae bacterium]|nr:AAA family ATPase [Methylococcaceae bacterium]
FLLLVMLAGEILFYTEPDAPEISYSRFLDKVYAYQIESVVISGDKIFGVMKAPGKKSKDQHPAPEESKAPSLPFKHTPWRLDIGDLTLKLKLTETQPLEEDPILAPEQRQFVVTAINNPDLPALLRNQKIEFSARIENHWLRNFLLNWIVPFVLLGCVWIMVSRSSLRPPPGALQFGKNKLRILSEEPKTLPRFTDLAGIDRAIEEAREIVAFLKDPERFTQLGASLPKGILLAGPPGSGKTLLARALAGESGVPFYNLDWTEFTKLFTGAGAPKMQELFTAAKRKAPCILFIDNLDTTAQARDKREPGAAATRNSETTENQLLSELDKVDGRTGIMQIAATSRPVMLDSAWLRPSRFNRAIVLDRPHKEGREQLFRKHCNRLVLADDIDFSELAAETLGMVGADIANLCNESALLAARCNREKITRADFREALQKASSGVKNGSLYLDQKNREILACHESGHTLVRHLTSPTDPLKRVSIVPRFCDSLANSFLHPSDERPLMSKAAVLGKIRILLAGRAAEEIVFGEVSTGAADDLGKANSLIREMLTTHGMSERLPNLASTCDRSLGESKVDAGYSAKTERILGQEHIELLDRLYQETKSLIQENRAKLDRLAQRLLEKEKIGARELKEILGPRPNPGKPEPSTGSAEALTVPDAARNDRLQ